MWTNRPVSMELRDGQHMGVETNELGKNAPPSFRMARVFGIKSSEPSSTSWSSVTIRIMLGFLGLVGGEAGDPGFREPA